MSDSKRKRLGLVVIVLIVAIMGAQAISDSDTRGLMQAGQSKRTTNAQELMVQLPGQFIVATFAGFREVISGALWVRADEFFHKGQYQAIIPILRLVSWMDPHNVDVYTTGAWHLAYNFVDESNRSDKRYIAAAIAFLEEGIANNPNRWNLYFELGWSHFSKKLEDYAKAVDCLRLACEKPGVDANTGIAVERPLFVDNMLAHMYEDAGEFESAIAQWDATIRRAETITSEKTGGEYVSRGMVGRDTAKANLARLYLRLAWRYGNMDYYRKGIELAKTLRTEVKWAVDGAEQDYKRRLAATTPPEDALKPLKLDLNFTVKKVKSRCIEIRGNLNAIRWEEYKGLASECYTRKYAENASRSANMRELWRDSSRVYWLLADEDYKFEIPDTFSWKVDPSRTLAWDSMYVEGGAFHANIDMSENLDIYPLRAKRYKLILWFSPLYPGSPDYVQDRIGWDGRCLIGENVDTWNQTFIRMLFPVQGQSEDTNYGFNYRVVKKEIILKQEDIL